MEDIDPNFAQKIIPGESIIVAGNNLAWAQAKQAFSH